MKITRADADRLILVDFPFWVGLIFFPLSLLYLVRFLMLVTAQPRQPGQWLVRLAAFAVCFTGASMFTQRSVFDFDLAARELRWRRRGLFTRAGGSVPLDDIRSVNLECCRNTNSNSKGRPRLCYRIVLHTAAGDGVLPLTQAYRSARDGGHIHQMREQITRALKLPLPNVADDVAELLKADRKTDAALMLSVLEDVDIGVAEKRVDAMVKAG
jgi:hypothetical protein